MTLEVAILALFWRLGLSVFACLMMLDLWLLDTERLVHVLTKKP